MSFVKRPYENESLKNFFAITKEVGYLCEIKQNKYLGEILVRPQVEDFFDFQGIKAFRHSHWTYNHLHFSTQVPARIPYLVSEPVSFDNDFWKKTTMITVSEDVTIFDRFTELEYMFVDSLVNHTNISWDGYFHGEDDLIEGIKDQMKNLSTKFPIDQEKVWREVLTKNPSLLPYK